MTWDDCMPAYASYLKGKYSATTARNYMQHIKYFIEQCPHPSPEDIRTADIQAYIDKLGESTKTKGSRYSILMGVKNFFKYLYGNHIIRYNPVRKIKLPETGDPKLPEPLTEEEITALLKASELDSTFTYKDKAIIETLYGTGITTGELRSLKIQDVDFEKECIKVYKGKRVRYIPMTRMMVDALLVYMHHRKKQRAQKGSEEYVFLSTFGKKLSPASIMWALNDLKDKAGIKKNIYGYCFRYSYMYALLQKGVEMRIVRKLCGIGSFDKTKFNPTLSFLRKIIRQCHPHS